MEFALGAIVFAVLALLGFVYWNRRAARSPAPVVETDWIEKVFEEATTTLVVEGLPAAPPAPPPLPLSVEEIHRKYEGLKETDPREAGRRIYAELLEVHGR